MAVALAESSVRSVLPLDDNTLRSGVDVTPGADKPKITEQMETTSE